MEEIIKLIDGDPDVLIKKAEEMGVDLGGLDKNIARVMVQKRFSLTEDQFEAVDFIFWIAYYVEREAEDLIIYPEVQIGARQKAMDVMMGKLHFGDKIGIIEELYSGKKDNFIKLMTKIQNMRNNVSHGRFDNLNYGGYNLSDNKGKMKLIAHLRDALKKG